MSFTVTNIDPILSDDIQKSRILIIVLITPALLAIIFYCGAATQRGLWPPHSWGF